MKKILLPALMSVFALTGFAQQRSEMTMMSHATRMASISNSPVQVADVRHADSRMSAPRKSYDTGVYYTKPTNAFWAGETVEGSYYYVSILSFAPNRAYTFVNLSTNKANSVWTYRDEDYDGDEEGNLNFGNVGCYQVNGYNNYGTVPTLKVGNEEFSLADMNINWATTYYSTAYESRPGSFGCVMECDSLATLAFTDHTHAMSGAAWGICHPDENTSYLFGNGEYLDTDKEGNILGRYKIFGCQQFYPAVDHMYLTSAHALSYNQDTPLPEGTQLTMTFYNVVEVDGQKRIGGEVLGQLFARPTDVHFLGGPGNTKYTSSGKYNVYSIEFKNSYQDEFGSWVDEPVVLNGEFAMVITGFDQDGVDVNFVGSLPNAEENFEGQTSVLCWEDETKSQSFGINYLSPVLIDMNFNALFDYAEILETGYDKDGNEYNNLNVLEVSADGKTVTNTHMGGNANFVELFTAYPWTDNEGIDNYYCELPEWVADLIVEEDEPTVQQNIEFRTGTLFATVECDPLPEGETGRYAIIYVEGKGVTSASPIIILQGDANLQDALDEIAANNVVGVKTSGKTLGGQLFNLNGQRVSHAQKGLYIKDGKKFFVK